MPIVASVDQSPRAESVIRHAYRLAESEHVELHVVHVGDYNVGHAKRSDQDSIESARQEAATIATEIAEQFIDPETFKAIGLVGEPGEKIIEYSNEHNVEYIVVSSRKRTRLDQAIFGGVTQTLLLAADRPIVAVP